MNLRIRIYVLRFCREQKTWELKLLRTSLRYLLGVGNVDNVNQFIKEVKWFNRSGHQLRR